MKWVSASSERSNLAEAIEECSDSLLASGIGSDPDLLIVFATHHYLFHYGVLVPELTRRLSADGLIGCSAGGVIGGGRELEQRPALAVTAARLPSVQRVLVHLESDELPPLDGSPRPWVDLIGMDPAAHPSFVVIADPFSMDANALLQGLDFAYPGCTKVGGLASGAQAAGTNALFAKDQTYSSGALILGLAGDIAVDTVVAQGCRPIGDPLRITECEDHLVQQLDGRPAVSVVQELFEDAVDRDRELMRRALFLGLLMDELRDEALPGEFLIRNIMGMDPDRGVIAVGANLRPGQTVQFHVRDDVAAGEDLETLLRDYRSRSQQHRPEGALLFSCLGRGVNLYGKPDHDSQMFAQQLGPVALGGFFCNGEIGPVSGTTYVHGYTSAFGLFRKRSRSSESGEEPA